MLLLNSNCCWTQATAGFGVPKAVSHPLGVFRACQKKTLGERGWGHDHCLCTEKTWVLGADEFRAMQKEFSLCVLISARLPKQSLMSLCRYYISEVEDFSHNSRNINAAAQTSFWSHTLPSSKNCSPSQSRIPALASYKPMSRNL